MIAAGAFDGDEAVLDVVLGKRIANLGDSCLKREQVVLKYCWRDEHLAVEVGDHELRTRFGAVDADEPEVLGADFLNTRMEGAARFVNDEPNIGSAGSAFAGCTGCSHEENLSS